MSKNLMAAALLGFAGAVCAQGAYPSRPVTLVVPFPPGGGTDTGARIVAQKLGARWGQTVMVENKGGAAGMIGADMVAKAKPDGYTLLMGNIGTQAINPSLCKKMPYDPGSAFAPIALVAELPLAMMGLDVFENEPHVPQELLALDNAVLLPHVASATVETRQAMADRVFDNLHRFFSEGRLVSPAPV